ncbi:hypothetical protein MZM54_03185 [[Brevibacterium] frigoritolerans]|nr:hypothetical protein [Peribacillus frigoritolerans]
MIMTLQEKILNEFQMVSAKKGFEFVVYSENQNKGRAYVMDKLDTILTFTYKFNPRLCSFTFFESDQDPVLGKPLSELGGDVLHHKNEQLKSLLDKFDHYLSTGHFLTEC